MKLKKDFLSDVILDALEMKFSKDDRLNTKIAGLFRGKRKIMRKGDLVRPVEVFAFKADDTLLLIQRNHPEKVKHLVFLNSHTEEPFHIQNLNNYRLKK